MSKPSSGLFKGTTGSQQTLISELESVGVKITKENIVFITKDATGQTVWLETGNSSAGLTHILQRHEKDFKEKHYVEANDIPNHLNKIFSYGKIEYSRPVIKNGREGYEKLIHYKDNYYLLSGIGTNGFIVSGYPIDKTTATKLKGRYKNK